jgi:sterol desaturase/sphingolipid hydroxylase (fatty acid hydroxylase superfamily)
VNDLAKNYASMPVEDIEQLALDAKSLTPEARATLRLEMERRQLSTQSLDATPQRKRLKPISWAEDWKNTGKRARAVLISLAVLVVMASLCGAVLNIHDHDYANAAAFPLPVALFGFRFVIFPFRIAWAARRRGGRFNRWLTGSMFFGFIFSGLAYVIWKADKPILPEYLTIYYQKS